MGNWRIIDFENAYLNFEIIMVTRYVYSIQILQFLEFMERQDFFYLPKGQLFSSHR